MSQVTFELYQLFIFILVLWNIDIYQTDHIWKGCETITSDVPLNALVQLCDPSIFDSDTKS